MSVDELPVVAVVFSAYAGPAFKNLPPLPLKNILMLWRGHGRPPLRAKAHPEEVGMPDICIGTTVVPVEDNRMVSISYLFLQQFQNTVLKPDISGVHHDKNMLLVSALPTGVVMPNKLQALPDVD
jgi:hypothetical protein